MVEGGVPTTINTSMQQLHNELSANAPSQQNEAPSSAYQLNSQITLEQDVKAQREKAVSELNNPLGVQEDDLNELNEEISQSMGDLKGFGGSGTKKTMLYARIDPTAAEDKKD